jgi:hypothetical protein
MGEDLVVLGEPVGVQLLGGPADGPVELPTPRHGERAVRDLLGQRVPEGVGGLRREPLLVDQLDGLQLAERGLGAAAEDAEPLEQTAGEAPSDDRGDLERGPGRLVEPLQARHDDVVHRVGDDDLVQRAGQDDAGSRRPHGAGLLERRDDLLDEEGIALGLDGDQALERFGQGLVREQGARHGGAVAGGERGEREPGVERAIGHRRLAGAEREDQQDRLGGQAVGHQSQPLLGRPVRPVHVLEDHDQRAALGGAEEEPAQGVEDLHATEPGIHGEEGGVLLLDLDGQEVAEAGQGRAEVVPERGDAVLQLGRDRRRRIGLVDLTGAAHQVDHRVKGDRPAVGHRLALQPGDAGADLPAELAEEPRLADAGLTHQGHDLPPAGLGLGQPLGQEPQLGGAAHEPRRLGRDLEVPAQAVDRQRGVRRGGDRGELEAPREEGRRASAHEARTGLGALDEGVEHRARRPPGVRVELDAVPQPADQDQVGVDGEAGQGPRRIGRARAGRHLLQRDRDVGGVARRILLGLEPERRDHASRRQLVHLAAEALHLVEDGLHEPAGIGGPGRALAGREHDRQQGHAPRLPADADGMDCGPLRRRGGAGRRRRRRAGGRRRLTGGGETVLVHAIAQRVARNAEPGRGAREVPVGGLEGLQEAGALPAAAPPARRCARRGIREPEPRRGHGADVGEQRHALHRVGQLADVPRPGVGAERVTGVRGERPGGQAVVLAGLGEEVLGEPHDVVAPLAEGRQADRQDGQAVVEVLAEAARPDGVLEVLAGGGHHPGVGGLAARAAEAADRALLDHLEELGLERLGREADLVQEEGPAVRGLEEPGLGLARVGERAPLVAEELGLEQGLGDGRAVDVDERPRRAGPGPVHELGEQALAGAGLTQDEDRRQPACAFAGMPEQPGELLAHRRDPGALAEQPLERRHVLIVLGHGAAVEGVPVGFAAERRRSARQLFASRPSARPCGARGAPACRVSWTRRRTSSRCTCRL